jgi:hypothetical protein
VANVVRRVERPAHGNPPVIFSFGAGLDSAALVLRWILEPESRDFALTDLTLVHAMTGDEVPQTTAAMAELFPLLAEHGIRVIQAQRGGPRKADGYIIAEDTHSPSVLHARAPGGFTLGDELTLNAVLPNIGGGRKCSQKAKGQVLDELIADLVGPDRDFVSIVGFDVTETSRMERDKAAGLQRFDGRRHVRYPLHEWMWDRAAATQYLADHGLSVERSACGYCPFGLRGIGKREGLARLTADQAATIDALRLEFRARAVNPTQTLGDTPLDQQMPDDIWTAYREMMPTETFALYRVRRVLGAGKGGPHTKGNNHARSLSVAAEGSYADMKAQLQDIADSHGLAVEVEGRDELIARVWFERRQKGYPTREELVTVAPAGARAKQGVSFAKRWESVPTERKESGLLLLGETTAASDPLLTRRPGASAPVPTTATPHRGR